jgi:sialidase-1
MNEVGRLRYDVPTGFFCRVSSLAVIAWSAVLPAAHLRATLLAETKPFISPKGPYVTLEASYHTFRIPGMIVAPDGSVLTFAEGRRGDGSDPRKDGNAPMDMTMRRSIDNGLTWEPLVVIDPGFQSNGDKVDFGDPTPVLDETTGIIHLLYGQWPDLANTTVDHGQSTDPADGNHVLWVQTSADNGVTWSARTQIIYPDEPFETGDGLYWRQAEPGPGSGIQLKWQDSNSSLNGRLVVPAKRSGSATPTGSVTVEPFVYYSDDHGATWQVSNVTSGPDANEDEVVELTNGDLLLDARQNSGSFRRRHLSTDGGVTWGPNNPDDIAITGVDGGMFRYSAVRDGHDRDRILFSGPLGPGRNDIAVWTSYDEGQTFINPTQFNSEFSAYSVVQRMGNGTIGLLVETSGDEPFNLGQSYGDITFYNFDLAELEKANHHPTMSHYDGFGNPIDSFRGGVGWSGAWSNSGATTDTGALEFNGYFTEGDDQHAHLRDADMARSFGSGSLDLNANQDYYFSLFVNHNSDDGTDSSSGEFLDVLLQDGSGTTQAAFGVGSGENFFVNELGGSVVSSNNALTFDTTYLVLVKLAAQDDSGGNFDQMFLAWYDDPLQIPTDETQISWQLVGNTTENFDGTIEQLEIAGGANADWLVDGLRIGTTFDAVIVDTGIGPPPVLGDLNNDFLLNIADWLVFRSNMTLDTSGLAEGEQLRVGDFDNSGLIGPADYIAFVDLYDTANGLGALIEAIEQIPEPSSLALVIIGKLVLLGRYRRRANFIKSSLRFSG